MRTFVGLLFTVIALNCALAGPVRSPNDDAEIVDVPRRGGVTRNDEGTLWDDDSKDFKGVITTNVGYPFLQPAPETANPFLFRSVFSDSFEDIFRRLHTSFFPLGLGLGGAGDDDASADPTGIEPFGFHIPNNVAKNGTTSTVKVVGGHKVEINETTYGDDNSVFKVRVVNIRPTDSDEDVKPTEAEGVDIKPFTSAPEKKNPTEKQDDDNERREPLEKNDADNEVNDLNTYNNEYLTISQQNNTIMLPRRIAITAQNNNSNVARLNAAFVADNGTEAVNPELKLKQYKIEEKLQQQRQQLDDDTKSISASGNIEAETNKLELVDNDEFDKHKSGDDSSASASNTIVRKDRLTMEYNEETEEQKNLNESSVDFVETQNWYGQEYVVEAEDENEKNHEFQVTTSPLEISTTTVEDYIEDEEKNTEFEEIIDKIATTSTTAEDFYQSEVDTEVSHLNLLINRDREGAESSSDDEHEQVQMSEAFENEWGDLVEQEEEKEKEEEKGQEQENLATDSSSNIDDNDFSNEIPLPVDLFNDILVNDYAAAHNVPLNPDAEYIAVTTTNLKNSSMPILENLSMK